MSLIKSIDGYKKITAFWIVILLVLANSVFKLGLPSDQVMYLVVTGVSYILGQGYVDGKKQTVSGFPVGDVSDAVSGILKAEVSKTKLSNELPIDEIMEMFNASLKAELAKLNLTVTIPMSSVAPAVVVGDTSGETPIDPSMVK